MAKKAPRSRISYLLDFIILVLVIVLLAVIFIPKKIWSTEEKRFLTFREILESGVGGYFFSEQYIQAGLEAVENNAEEILDLAKEMNERLNGNFEYTEEDEELQNKFHSLYQ
ncbi:MAG: TIGR04372 family glycosyltransferase, partial [Fidelibacterota bacterium]